MLSDNAPAEIDTELAAFLASNVYKDNIQFWERAWNMVKTPYTQMPALSYIEKLPGYLRDAEVQTVLDLGCGSGWLSVLLARQGFSVTGIDISAHAIDLAKIWAKDENLNITFKVCDIANLHSFTGSFNAIVANSIFEHFTYDIAKIIISKLHKMLTPGGIFFGCFDKVGYGKGEYYQLNDGTYVYTDKARLGMLLRYFSNDELKLLFKDWTVTLLEEIPSGSRLLYANT